MKQILSILTILLLRVCWAVDDGQDIALVWGEELVVDLMHIEYPAGEKVIVTPAGDILGITYKLSSQSGEVIISAGKWTKHINALSLSSIRLFATYTLPPYTDRITAGSGNILLSKKVTNGYELLISTNNHVAPASQLFDGFEFFLTHIYVNLMVDAIYDNSVHTSPCQRLHPHTEVLDLLQGTKITADIAFIKCFVPTAIGRRCVLSGAAIVPLGFKKTNSSVTGVGYPGAVPAAHDELFGSQRRIATVGSYALHDPHQIYHDAPTKKGMSGSAMTSHNAPLRTFGCVHFGEFGDLNGCVSVLNPAFACLYARYVAQAALVDGYKRQQQAVVTYLKLVLETLNSTCVGIKATADTAIQTHEAGGYENSIIDLYEEDAELVGDAKPTLVDDKQHDEL